MFDMTIERIFTTVGCSGRAGSHHVHHDFLCSLSIFGLELYLCKVVSLGGDYPLRFRWKDELTDIPTGARAESILVFPVRNNGWGHPMFAVLCHIVTKTT